MREIRLYLLCASKVLTMDNHYEYGIDISRCAGRRSDDARCRKHEGCVGTLLCTMIFAHSQSRSSLILLISRNRRFVRARDEGSGRVHVRAYRALIAASAKPPVKIHASVASGRLSLGREIICIKGGRIIQISAYICTLSARIINPLPPDVFIRDGH